MVPETLCVGSLQTNCYLLGGDLDPDCVLVIDPGAQASRILNALGERRVQAVLLTHGHFDHTGALSAFDGKDILIGEADAGIVSIETANAYFLHEPDCGMCLAEGLAFSPAEQYRGYRVAANKGETELIAFVNGVINEATANDNELLEKWLEEARNRAEALGL